MLNFLKNKQQKDPICGMDAKENFISKYGEKFCSETCVKKYEEQNHIAGDEHSAKKNGWMLSLIICKINFGKK